MFRVRRAAGAPVVGVLLALILLAASAAPSTAAAQPAAQPEDNQLSHPAIQRRLNKLVSQSDRAIKRRNGETNAVSIVGRPNLTGPNKGSASEIAFGYVTENLAEFGVNKAAINSLTVVKDADSPSGIHFVTIGQTMAGHPVLNSGVTVTLDGDGRVIAATGRLIQPRAAKAQRFGIGAQRAIQAAAAEVRVDVPNVLRRAKAENPAQARKELFVNSFAKVHDPNPVTAEMAWLPSRDGSGLTLVWETDFEVDGHRWLHSLVSVATGKVLAQSNRYAHADAEGTVFTGQHPDDSPARAVVPFSGLDGSWVDDRTTDGNNVIAYRDLNNDNTVGYQPQTPDNADPEHQHFNYAWTDAWRTNADGADASLDADIDAVITQLFYYTNVMHDWAYGFGFDEPSGNFQEDNFGRGGSGGDPVLAEAQDGWDFGCADGVAPDPDRCQNNAFFGTPADGLNPRMQMYMWAPGRPYRDGSMDGDVVAHEYGHGISTRLVGDGTGGAGGLNYGGHRMHSSLGEGWSDVVSFLIWGDAVVGEYVTGNANRGIRRVAYDTSDHLYSDYNPNAGSGHPNGEVWATMIYDIRAELGLAATTQLVFDGMKGTPGSPDFQDARDAIIAADAATGGANFCLLWSAFAARGLGLNSTFSFASASAPTDNFDIPASCEPSADAGGPYTTDEGVDVVLDGTGSDAGSDPSAGAIVSYEWDFDGVGDYDDASGPTPTFDLVGQDGVYNIGLRITDDFGNTETDSTTVTVDNVEPAVAVSPVAPITEGETATVSGTVTDPGWLDPLTVTIDWGTGAQPVAGALENIRPDATLTFSADYTYGDNGVFTVEVCGSDDDSTVCVNTNITVTNVDPTADIDEDLYLAHAAEVLTVTGTSTDPGSDDLTATWNWGDGGADTVDVNLVNPPDVDPVMSPTVQPRDVAWTADHTYAEACLYNLELGVVDDDGGAASDSAVVIITGNETEVRGKGWWKNQYRPKPPNHLSEERLLCYLAIVNHMSDVFDEVRSPLATRDDAVDVLFVNGNGGSAEEIFDAHLLTAWLNFASGYYDLDTLVDTNGNGIPDSVFQLVVETAEAARVNPATTRDELLAQKDILEGLID